jgi:Ulp1 family protease
LRAGQARLTNRHLNFSSLLRRAVTHAKERSQSYRKAKTLTTANRSEQTFQQETRSKDFAKANRAQKTIQTEEERTA